MNRPTFSQEQGITRLPTQAQLGTIIKATSAALWQIVHDTISAASMSPNFRRTWIGEVLCDWWVKIAHGMIDEAPQLPLAWKRMIRGVFDRGFPATYDLVQFLLQHEAFDSQLKGFIAEALENTQAAYRVVEDRVVPFASIEEFEQLKVAVQNSNASGASGAKAHLLTASAELTKGNWGSAVHESISSVESAARFATKSHQKGLSDLLKELGKSGAIGHPALLSAIGKLYAYTSDAQGVRHSLVLEGKADVTEREAFLLLGLCAAIVSYILGPRENG